METNRIGDTLMYKPEFRFKKRHFVHEDKVLKTSSIMQIKDKEGYWNDVPVFDEVIKLANAKDVDYY